MGRGAVPVRAANDAVALVEEERMTGRRRLRDSIVLLIALLLLSARGGAGADETLKVQRLVATFTARFDGVDQVGTAVVFALTPDRIHLVTAAHVVRHKRRRPTAIELRLGGSDRVVRARLERFDDKTLDIAVLVVARRDASGFALDELPFDR